MNPGPWSRTHSASVMQADVDRPAGGLHLRALSITLVTARAHAVGSVDDHRRLQLEAERSCGARRWARATASSHDLVELDRLGVLARRRSTGELHDVGDELRQLVELGDDRVLQAGALLRGKPVGLQEDLDVAAQRGHRGAQLMGGVEDQVTLGLDRALEGVERVVEARREPAQLAGARLLEPPGTVQGAGDLLGLLGEALDRGQRGSGDAAPSSPASSTPPPTSRP